MPEGLATAEGERIDFDQTERKFAAAMAAPSPDDPEAPAPPDVPAADPEAPWGRTADGRPKRKPGRPPKNRARTVPGSQVSKAEPAAKGGKGDSQARPGRDYTEGLSDFTQLLWMGLAGLPIPGDERRIRCRVQAAVLKENQAGVVSGVNIMAQHSGPVRWVVEKLATGEASWIFPAVLALMPFAVQTSMLWRVPVNGDMAKMAEGVESEFGEVFASILQQMGLVDDEQPEPAAAA
jgi:hypothetical protein